MVSLLVVGLFVVLMLTGFPVAVSLVLATIAGMVAGDYNLILMPQQTAASVASLELMAIPFFILAACLMTELGMTRRIFDFAEATIGWLKGGLAHANVVAGVIFSGISGAAVADAAALGSISMKEMPRAGYDPPFSAAVVIAVSTLGPIIPPSIMMVVYAITADVSIARLFLAGLGPGLLIAVMISTLIFVMTRFGFTPSPAPTPFSWPRLWRATKTSALALAAPIVILRGMTAGWVTPTEAGILACVYALFVGAVERTLRLGLLMRALRETAEASAHCLFIIATSSALTYIFVAEGTAAQLSGLLMANSVGPVSFMVLTNLLLLVLGCLVETMPAMLLVLPLLLPTAKMLGIDLVHLGIVVIFNLLIGIMTPPMGIGLYILMSVSRLKMGELVIAVLPFIGILLLALAILTAFPAISLWLPDQLMPVPGRSP